MNVQYAKEVTELPAGSGGMAETLLMLENTNVTKKCVFRSNHASNYVSLRGDLPDDKEKMMNMLRKAMKNHDMFRDERFRAL